jgi:hypothetical protein
VNYVTYGGQQNEQFANATYRYALGPPHPVPGTPRVSHVSKSCGVDMSQESGSRLSCPSAQPGQTASTVIGVVGRQGGKPQVSLLPQPVSLHAVAHLIPDTIPVTEVLRLAAPCAERHCSHFNDQRCTLASRIVSRLPAVVDRLSPCALRPSCRWWRQEGRPACQRCPQIVTEPLHPSEQMRELATPAVTSVTASTSTKGESNRV